MALRACLVLLLLSGALALGGEPAAATHPTEYCDPYDGRSTLIELTTPDRLTGFYIHDRSSVPGTGSIGVVDEHRGGTWVFMENGEKAGLQTGGQDIVFLLGYPESGDWYCPRSSASDPVIF